MSSSEALVRDYLRKIEQLHRAGNATEHTFRPALQDLLEGIGGSQITATNEPKRVKCGAPDYVLTRNTGNGIFTVGYVEAKDIVGVSLDKVEQSDQMARYKRALDNLVLTDYLEFRWFIKGEKQPMTARLATVQPNRSLQIDKNGIGSVESLLKSFLGRPVESIKGPSELAKRMARLTHIIRDTVEEAFDKREASETLQGLFEAFKSVLLPELPVPQFADMFAQTLAYGLFAARYNHKARTPFDRRDAAKEIPKTNPFLRKLFTMIAGPDFDDEPFIGFVNELTQVLGVTDMDAVLADFGKRTRQEDPIVHFYETFLAQYDPKLRELRGVYYTPEPVVSYIVRSVDSLLREQFDCEEGLADTATVLRSFTDEQGEKRTERVPRVLLLDPACGTGTFSYSIIDHIRQTFRQSNNAGMWSGYVREHLLPRLFGFELLMAPYAVAHLKLGMQLAALDLPVAERADWAYDFASDERLGVYLTNTLEQTLGTGPAQLLLGGFISDEANEATKVKQDYPVMVIVGNPPYSGHSANKGKWINELLHGMDGRTGKKIGNYFEVDGKPLNERNTKWLNDDYVKFIRFSQWRIEQTGYGILAFITNHGYLDNPTFRGMRQSLMQTFDDIYVLDLHGNTKKKEHSPDGGNDKNVFDIQQGVAIGIFVKKQVKPSVSKLANVYHAHLWGEREIYEKAGQERRLVDGKYYWLAANDTGTTKWTRLEPHAPFYLFRQQDVFLQIEYAEGWKIEQVMATYSLGVLTKRDHLVVDFDEVDVMKKIRAFVNKSLSDDDCAVQFDLPFSDKDKWNLKKARQVVTETLSSEYKETLVYRPFDQRSLYYHESLVARQNKRVMQHMQQENLAIILGRQGDATGSDDWDVLFATASLTDQNVYRRGGGTVFPLYLYPDSLQQSLLDTDEPSTAPGGRRPNLSPAFIAALSEKLSMRFVADGKGDLVHEFVPEDVVDYMYAVFHAPTYRARYAEFLKIDFPRLPLTSDVDLFRALCGLGQRLVALHLMESFSKSVVSGFPVKGNNVVERVEYQEPSPSIVMPPTPTQTAQNEGRVYINKTQYFSGVPADAWAFHVGGYQVCHKWLKDRKGRALTFADIQHYQRVVGALAETITLMEQVDMVIEEHGGWPLG